ncbi:hypothetical protein [Nocardia cyriacigeorgica]|uniref:hypothetical protein n=1 Tax=Nocardia cyriacigeorgica TaxID=135487 RepID=UPI002016ED06|nr:hypothetical protein [Nocardia cyriacigeorgica]
MTSEFRVDIDRLDNIVSRLSGLADFLAGHLDDLENKVQALHGRVSQRRRMSTRIPNGQWERASFLTAYDS